MNGLTAYAQATGGGALSGLGTLVPILLMIVIFYFLLIRPQQKKEKERKKMIDAIQKGDRVLTMGGIYGTVTNVKPEDNIIVVKIADGAKVEFAKTAIQNKLS